MYKSLDIYIYIFAKIQSIIWTLFQMSHNFLETQLFSATHPQLIYRCLIIIH